MKNKQTIAKKHSLLAIALVAVIAFAASAAFALTFTSCDNGTTNDPAGYTPAPTNPFIGTWYGTGNAAGFTLVFTSTTFSLSNGASTAPGTYTWSGYRATLTDRSGDTGTAVISGNILTLTWDGTVIPFDNSGGYNPGPTTVAVTGVSLNLTSLNLAVGDTATLTATVSPSNATNKAVTWSTNNSSVARVSNGTVTAVGAGTTYIVVTTVDGSRTATCSVTVTAPVNLSLDGVWQSDTGHRAGVITINGSTGTYTQFLSTLYQDAVSKGYIKVGDQAFRNLTSSGNLQWRGQQYAVYRNSFAPNVAIYADWTNITITLNANGQTFQLYMGESSVPDSTYNRVR